MITKQSLENLFNPLIRVVPEKDWSKIKAIWIPLLHHDYNNRLEKSGAIIITQKSIDKFGTVQAYVSASNENYIPYLTTFFNPNFTQEEVLEKIVQAQANILITENIVTDSTGELIIRKTKIGVAKSGMMITIVFDQAEKIIDAFPIFNTHDKE